MKAPPLSPWQVRLNILGPMHHERPLKWLVENIPPDFVLVKFLKVQTVQKSLYLEI